MRCRNRQKQRPYSGDLRTGFICLVLAVVIAGPAASAADWPGFRGPRHNGISPEGSGYPNAWPPKQLWKANVGRGCTSPIVAAGCVYVMGWRGEKGRGNPVGQDTVFCYEAQTGELLWKRSYPSRYQGRHRTGDTGAYGGPSSTPSLDTESGLLYTLSIDGELRCWDVTKEGRSVWSVNFYDKYKIPRRPAVTRRGVRDYGYSSSLVLYKDLVIAEVGDDDGLLMAFDKAGGKRVWTSRAGGFAGHNAGPVPMKVNGVPCVASLTIRKLLVVRIDGSNAGTTVAEYEWATDFANNIAAPAVTGNRLTLSSGYNQSRTALLEVGKDSMRRIWTSKHHTKVCTPVIYKGNIYFTENRIKCLDLKTGKLKWQGDRAGRGSCLITAADDKLLAFGNRTLTLAEADAKDGKYRRLAQIKGICSDVCYPHIALSDGLLLCKDRAGNLVCFSLRND